MGNHPPRRNLLHILLSDPHRDRLEERAVALMDRILPRREIWLAEPF